MTDSRQCLGRKRLFYFFDDFVESLRIVNCHFRKHFSIEIDVCLLEAVDEFAVTQPALAYRRVDARDPQAAEVTFSTASITKGKSLGSNQRLFDGSQQIPATTTITLRLAKQTAFGLVPRRTFDRSHRSNRSFIGHDQGPFVKVC